MTETGRLWLTIVLAGAGTFVARISFLGVAHRISDPPIARAAGPAHDPARGPGRPGAARLRPPRGHFDLTQPRLVAGIIATAVAFRTKNVLVTLAVGMAVLIVLDQL